MSVLDELQPYLATALRKRRSVEALEDMDVELKRSAYQLARSTLRERSGYELSAMNRKSDPKEWSQDFRETVLMAAEILKQQSEGKIVVKQITIKEPKG